MIRAATLKKREIERLGIKVFYICRWGREGFPEGFRLTVTYGAPRLPGEYRREGPCTTNGKNAILWDLVFVSA